MNEATYGPGSIGLIDADGICQRSIYTETVQELDLELFDFLTKPVDTVGFLFAIFSQGPEGKALGIGVIGLGIKKNRHGNLAFVRVESTGTRNSVPTPRA